MKPQSRTLNRARPAPVEPPAAPTPIAVVDVGASAVKLVVAEARPSEAPRVLEEISRAVPLGRDVFTSGRLGAATIESALKALEGFRRILDTYGVVRYRAVATSAVREAENRDTFLDRVRLRTGLELEVIDGSEENRLTYLAVRDVLRNHPALAQGDTILVEVGGGSADLSLLRSGEPRHSGTYALGSIRIRQGVGSGPTSHEARVRLMRRHIENVVDDIRSEIPLKDVRHFVALGSDVRFAAETLDGEAVVEEAALRTVRRDAFVTFCEEVATQDAEQLTERYRLTPLAADTLGPALLAYRALLVETAADTVTVPDVSLRAGLLLDIVGEGGERGMADLSRQVLASAVALGEKYRYDAAHGKAVAHLACRVFDDLQGEHGLGPRERLLLEVAALLHDIGTFVSLRGHHKHAQYLLSVSDIFGLSRDDMAIVSNVARYHRRALPQRSHLAYTSLPSETRVVVNKLAAILRVTNALDADHLQKIREVRILRETDGWVIEVEGVGDLTMERLATLARADQLTEVFGRRIAFREAGLRT